MGRDEEHKKKGRGRGGTDEGQDGYYAVGPFASTFGSLITFKRPRCMPRLVHPQSTTDKNKIKSPRNQRNDDSKGIVDSGEVQI